MRTCFIVGPRWLLLAALVFAPWAYGCTEDWAITALNWIMAGCAGWWLAGTALRQSWPAIPLICTAAALATLALGWIITWNTKYWCHPETLEFFPIKSFWEVGPGTADRVLSVPAMFRITGLLGILCFVSDLSQRPLWRARIWRTLAATGASITLFGLIQKLLQAPKIFWEQGSTEGWHQNFFATYFYHANAGAFINLVLPLLAGLAALAFRHGDPTKQAMWVPALFITVAAAFVNVSKAASIIAIGLLIFLGYQQLRQRLGQFIAVSWKVRLVYLLFGLGLLATIFGVARQTLLLRWTDELWMTQSGMVRVLANQVSLRALGDAGPWGFGPGTFQHVFPHYTQELGEKIQGYWKHAHQDYLQTLIEWGWIGWVPLAILLFGGIGLASFQSGKAVHHADRVLLQMAGLALVGISVHALVDFPLQISSLQLYTAVLLGLAWGAPRWDSPTSPEKPGNESLSQPRTS